MSTPVRKEDFFAFEISIPPIPSEFKSLFPSAYIYVYDVQRDPYARLPILASPEIVQGMKDPSKLGSDSRDRLTVMLNMKSFFTTNKPFLCSLAAYKKCVEEDDFSAIDGEIPGAASGVKIHSDQDSQVDHAMRKGIRISLMYRCAVEALSNDEKTMAAKNGVALYTNQNELRPTQIGEYYFNAWDICHALTTKNAICESPLVGNGSDVDRGLHLTQNARLKSRYDVVMAADSLWAKLARAVMLEWTSFSRKQNKAFAEFEKHIETVQTKLYSGYYSFGAAEKMSLAELNAATPTALNQGQILPKLPGMARFHVPWWITYGLLTTHEMRTRAESLKLPVWFYSLSRGDINMFFANKVRFLSTILQTACDAYSIAPSELQAVLTPFLSADPSKWSNEVSIAGLVAARDVIAHMLTLPGFMGKYRSDFIASYEGGEIRVKGTESCDENRVTGQSDSGDCEDLEVTTRETWDMLISLVDGSKSPSNKIQAYDTTGVLEILAKFLHTHYQYLSASTSTTADYPGSKLLEVATEIDQNKAAREFTSRDYQMLALLKFDSPDSARAKLGFHQCSLLVPSLQMYEIMGRESEFDKIAARENPEAIRTALDFYKMKAEQSAKALGFVNVANSLEVFVPPGIVLESTFPVSTQLVATSVYLTPRLKSAETYDTISEYRRKVFDRDIAAIQYAGKMRDYSMDIGEMSARIKDIHVLRLMAGHPDSRKRIVVVDIDHDRYSTVFWRDICHTVNVTLLKYATKQLKIGPSVAGAASYSTWIESGTNRFGVPMEDFLLGCLRPEKNFFAVRAQHKLCHPFLRAPKAALESLDACIEDLDIVAQRPPIVLGSQEFSSYEDTQNRNVAVPFYGSESKPTKDFALRVIDARIMMVEGERASEKVPKLLPRFKEVAGAEPNSPHVTQTLRLFPVFGQESTFVYLQATK